MKLLLSSINSMQCKQACYWMVNTYPFDLKYTKVLVDLNTRTINQSIVCHACMWHEDAGKWAHLVVQSSDKPEDKVAVLFVNV
jgi:hypothetical protein